MFIVNPTAGKGNALEMLNKIHSRFQDFAQTYEIKVTEAVGHACALAKQATDNNDAVRIYAVGGDGTLNEVLNGMAGTNAELGVIPCGSGNDAVRSLYKITDPIKLLEILPDSQSVRVDLGKFNEKYFINIASIGFDAEVVLTTQTFKRFPLISGSVAYILGVFTTLIKLKKYKLSFSINGNPKIEKKILMSIFANGTHYGGGMKSAPSAKIDDGILDFYLVDAMSRLKILKFFPAFIKGKHESFKEVTIIRGTGAFVESDLPFPINIDGEISMETKVAISLYPASVRIITPDITH